MKIFTLAPTAIEMLRDLCGRVVEQVVWDINAVYFVEQHNALKVEAQAERPESPAPDESDELLCLTAERLEQAPRFYSGGEEGFWYKVLGENVRILGIDLVRTSILFPSETLAHPSAWEENPQIGVNIVDCGLLVHMEEGILPAVQRQNSFGFHSWPEIRLYKSSEVEAVLGPDYQVIPLCRSEVQQ